MIHQEISAEHVVDIHKVVADFRDAFERIESPSSQSDGVIQYSSSHAPEQKRPSTYNWNPGPDVERKILSRNKLRESGTSLFFKSVLSKLNTKLFMHVFTLPTLRAVRFSSTRTPSTLTSASNRSTFATRGEVEGEEGWVLQGVVSRASVRRTAASGQKVFTVFSLHISNIFSMKIIQTIRLQVISMAQLGVVAAMTISVLSIK